MDETNRLAYPLEDEETTELTYYALRKRLFDRREKKRLNSVTVTETMPDELKLYNISSNAHETLFSMKAGFPFGMYPDSISMDRNQLTIIHRNFFKTSNTIIVQTADILSAEMNLGIVFGSLHIYSSYAISNVDRIYHLPRSSVEKAQRLIQGYIIAHRKGIDCSTIPRDQLIQLLDYLGTPA